MTTNEIPEAEATVRALFRTAKSIERKADHPQVAFIVTKRTGRQVLATVHRTPTGALMVIDTNL